MFIVPKARGEGHGFEFVQAAEDGAPGGGKMEGRPIDTIGYRGMHSYEIAFDAWFVADANLVGGEGGLGQGFYSRWPASRTAGCRPPPGPSA